MIPWENVLWIVPVAFLLGFFAAALLARATRDDNPVKEIRDVRQGRAGL